MVVLDFGHRLLWVAAAVIAAVFLLAVLGIVLRDRRWVLGARAALYVNFVLLLGASAALSHGFMAGAYNNEYIFFHSEKGLFDGFKLAGLWAGLEGSLIFWTFVLSLMSAVAAFQHRWSGRHAAGRRLEPYTYVVLSSVLGFFIYLCLRENAFAAMPTDHVIAFAQRYKVGIDAGGNLLDGKGLHPQLNNYWFVIHPPCLYLGLITFTVPFAFGLAALISGELGDYWVRIARRWAMVSWIFLTSGIILGGLWAYRQLGWGGYWAWDPVENASFLPWCTATAFLHSIMIQERRDMLKWWNAFLVLFTFYLTIEATYMTRSGEVSSIHTFALNQSLGDIFRYFKCAIAGIGLFLLFYRFRDLRGTHRLESLLSREAAFFFNNLILVAICLAVWFLSWLPTNSHDYMGERATVDVPYYNKVMTPLFAGLLFLTAVGPGLGWVKSSAASLRKNFLAPVAIASAVTGLVYWLLAAQGRIRSAREVFVPKPIDDLVRGSKETQDVFYSAGIYPTGIFIFLSVLVIATVSCEFVRAVAGRKRVRGEGLLTAAATIFTRDNRRYGGYVVHIGIALLTLGIISTSMFRTYEDLFLSIGESRRVGGYVVTPVAANRSFSEFEAAFAGLHDGSLTLAEVQPGTEYLLDDVLVRVTKAPSTGLLPTAEGQEAPGTDSGAAGDASAAASEVVCELRPERRYYPKQEEWIPEVSIDRGLLRDIYLTYRHREGDSVRIEVFLNPLMALIWIGWFTMLGGALYALLPLGRGRVGLSE